MAPTTKEGRKRQNASSLRPTKTKKKKPIEEDKKENISVSLNIQAPPSSCTISDKRSFSLAPNESGQKETHNDDKEEYVCSEDGSMHEDQKVVDDYFAANTMAHVDRDVLYKAQKRWGQYVLVLKEYNFILLPSCSEWEKINVDTLSINHHSSAYIYIVLEMRKVGMTFDGQRRERWYEKKNIVPLVYLDEFDHNLDRKMQEVSTCLMNYFAPKDFPEMYEVFEKVVSVE